MSLLHVSRAGFPFKAYLLVGWDLVVLQGSGKENMPFSGLKVRVPNDAVAAEGLGCGTDQV